MQGGIHPDYTGQTYLDILHTVRAATPAMHIHAFSPLEVWQGAADAGGGCRAPSWGSLQAAGLNTLPGTAAEILDDEVRQTLCPDKLNTAQWLEVMEAAHRAGPAHHRDHHVRPYRTARGTGRATCWQIRELQQRTGGFTEFVPLPFVHMEAPMYLKGNARRGPSFREAVLMHAVARLVFHGLIDNIQASWVKMGEEGVAACLGAGANDLGGTLMNESITRAAGSGHGQEWAPAGMEQQIARRAGDRRMRTTLYADAPGARREAAFGAARCKRWTMRPPAKRQRSKRLPRCWLRQADQSSASYRMSHRCMSR